MLFRWQVGALHDVIASREVCQDVDDAGLHARHGPALHRRRQENDGTGTIQPEFRNLQSTN